MRFKPSLIAIAYIGTILVFAFLYYIYQDQFKNLATPLDSFYFSVVTITTLGYGDVLPTTILGKALVSAQALLGVSAIGLLFVSIGQSISEASTKRQNRASVNNFKIQYQIFRKNLFDNCSEFFTDEQFIKIPGGPKFDSRKFYNTQSDQDSLTLELSECLLDWVKFYENTFLGLKILEQNLESFIDRVLIEDANILEKLTTYRDDFHRVQSMKIDTREHREDVAYKIFELFTNLNAFKGENDSDELLNLVENC